MGGAKVLIVQEGLRASDRLRKRFARFVLPVSAEPGQTLLKRVDSASGMSQTCEQRREAGALLVYGVIDRFAWHDLDLNWRWGFGSVLVNLCRAVGAANRLRPVFR